MVKTAVKKLLYIPIIHSSADMGSLSESLKKEYLSRYGARKWQEHAREIEGFWDLVTRRVLSLPLNFRRVKVYQDGLPYCGRELDIAREAAAKGSQNHQLLLSLVSRGGTLVGTESPELLLEEYHFLKAMVEGTGQAASLRQAQDRPLDQAQDRPQAEAELMRRRDAFIARRIAETLAEGETGLLFIGALHRVKGLLPKNIQVRYPFPPPGINS
jgi:hypothetical protein